MPDRARQWVERNVPRLDGAVAVVTGANGGLGLATTRWLALRGARVVMACRSFERGSAAVREVRATMPGASVSLELLDLADLSSVAECACKISAACDHVDILINNAGIMAIPRSTTRDGFEMQFGVNHLGHFAFTAQLFDRVKASPHGRVVTVSSQVYSMGSISFDDPNWHHGYSAWRAYAQSKLANLVFARELSRRTSRAGLAAVSVSAHPGYASTNLQHVAPRMNGSRLVDRIVSIANRCIGQTPGMGALPTVLAATSSLVANGALTGPRGPLRLRGFPAGQRIAPHAADVALGARLWELSESLTSIPFHV